MTYFCISWTHKNTELILREKFSFSDEETKKQFLSQLIKHQNIQESLLLSTCNRVEIFAFVKDKNKAGYLLASVLAEFYKLDTNELYNRADLFEDTGAIHHLFSVASSLDSLVVGETQIARQLKEAFIFALEHKFCDIHLSRAVHYAFKCAAVIRAQTQISKNPVSVSSVAVAKAKELLSLEDRKVIVIGAGEMSELACKYLLAARAHIILLNRSLEKSKELALKLGRGVKIDSLDKLEHYLNTHELFFSATNSPHCIITDTMLKEVSFTRYFFDIAVPRDIDLKQGKNVQVFAVDDLKEVVKTNLALREEQAKIAYKIIGTMTESFFRYLNKLTLTPIIRDLRLEAKRCSQEILSKALKKGYLKGSDEEEARKLIHQAFKAFLHTPTLRLKELEGQIQSDTIINALRYVFALEDEKSGLNEYKCELNLKDN
ncbi:glutamyl-tRNA reductase [Campylobacter sp. MIT 97-5078]|uniref:glutamyl-tRNA reductase n=1 Tax=Campylobacter sp. MIT 97-5078 TaxID=1548153 RepID=UPI0005136B4A|nr:glutamyl-tRNA reductase [Campylobacter sp. MIT 97-5078]KGI57014.1 glutamyl-tRNA reductase [Campylobacter sp. MIT 97-5078]TQR28155.1 glutamyl-tRNA reductase [Campylobacter sp. MIT 97-5078]